MVQIYSEKVTPPKKQKINICLKKNQTTPRPSEHPPVMGEKNRCLTKNQNAPRASEHPPVRGENMSKRLGGIKGCKYKTSSRHLNGCYFSHSAYWLPIRKNYLNYTVVNPTRGLLNREKKEKEKAAHPSPRCPFGENKIKQKSRDASPCLGATQVSVRLASAQGFLRLVGWDNGCRFARFYASVCDNNFPSLAAS